MIMDINVKDVLFGRDKVCFNHVGNARFRLVISNHAEEYEHAPCRRDKSCIVYNVFNIVKAYEGRFLKRDGGGWKEVSDTEATQKVGHALRDKKQHEMRLRLKADRDEAKEARSSNTIAISAKSPKPIVSKETSAVKKIKKIKPPKKDFAKKEPMQDFASALMKLGEICSQEMEHLKSGDSQRSSDSDNEASQSSETSNYVSNNENETCASSILAMMSHRKRNGSSKAKMQQEEKASQDCSPRPSFELSKSDGESCHAQLPRGFDPEKQMEFMSNSKISVAQQAELGTLKASIHQAIRDDAMMLAEQSRAVTPPSLDDKQLQSGWTYYPLAIPNYALQGGGAWKLRLVPANGQAGGSIDFDPRTGFPGTASNASNMQTYHV